MSVNVIKFVYVSCDCYLYTDGDFDVHMSQALHDLMQHSLMLNAIEYI